LTEPVVMKGKVLCVTFIVFAAALTGYASAQDDVWISSTTYANVNALTDDGDYLWAGTEWGLTRLHKTTGDIELYNERLGAELPSEQISALAIDHEGTVWIGTDGGGTVSYDGTAWTVYNTGNSDLFRNNVDALTIDTQGNIWLGTGLLTKFDGENWMKFSSSNSELPGNTVQCLSTDDQGNVWIGTKKGLAQFDGENWTVYTTGNSDLPNNNVKSLTIDIQGNIWIGTNWGLAKFDGENWMKFYSNDSGLPHNTVQCLSTDDQGNVWIVTKKGLAQFDGENWTVYNTDNSGLSNNTILALTADSEGSIWAGTPDGLAHFDGETWKERNTGILAGKNTWSQRASMPTAKYGHSSCVLDGKIYVMGGSITDTSGAFKKMDVYDPILNTWTAKADMTLVRTNFTTCVLNGKIYAAGGSTTLYASAPNNKIEEYDPATDTWTHITDMPRARMCHTASVVNGKIYIIGGIDGDEICYAEVDEYDPATDTWTTKEANMPTPRACLGAVVLNEKIYAIGGGLGKPGSYSRTRKVEVYDPATDTWTTKASMLQVRGHFSGCALEGKIYVFGGNISSYADPLSHAEEYDPSTDTWTEILNLPRGLLKFSVAAIDGKIYISGGSLTQKYAATVVPSMYVFDPGGEPVRVDDMIPVEFALVQNYPNPFNPATTINYRLDQAGMVNLVIYDLLGRKVTTLVDEMKTLGNHTITWNAEDFASGIYFYRIETGDSKVLTQKMLLVK